MNFVHGIVPATLADSYRSQLQFLSSDEASGRVTWLSGLSNPAVSQFAAQS